MFPDEAPKQLGVMTVECTNGAADERPYASSVHTAISFIESELLSPDPTSQEDSSTSQEDSGEGYSHV